MEQSLGAVQPTLGQVATDAGLLSEAAGESEPGSKKEHHGVGQWDFFPVPPPFRTKHPRACRETPGGNPFGRVGPPHRPCLRWHDLLRTVDGRTAIHPATSRWPQRLRAEVAWCLRKFSLKHGRPEDRRKTGQPFGRAKSNQNSVESVRKAGILWGARKEFTTITPPRVPNHL